MCEENAGLLTARNGEMEAIEYCADCSDPFFESELEYFAGFLICKTCLPSVLDLGEGGFAAMLEAREQLAYEETLDASVAPSLWKEEDGANE